MWWGTCIDVAEEPQDGEVGGEVRPRQLLIHGPRHQLVEQEAGCEAERWMERGMPEVVLLDHEPTLKGVGFLCRI